MDGRAECQHAVDADEALASPRRRSGMTYRQVIDCNGAAGNAHACLETKGALKSPHLECDRLQQNELVLTASWTAGEKPSSACLRRTRAHYWQASPAGFEAAGSSRTSRTAASELGEESVAKALPTETMLDCSRKHTDGRPR